MKNYWLCCLLKDKLEVKIRTYTAILEFLNVRKIDINKLISTATGGAPSMTRKNKGFVTIFKLNVKHDIFTFHCIIHQQALGANVS